MCRRNSLQFKSICLYLTHALKLVTILGDIYAYHTPPALQVTLVYHIYANKLQPILVTILYDILALFINVVLGFL